MTSLLTKEHRTINYVSGPLAFVRRTRDVGYREIVELALPDGSRRTGEVLEVDKDLAVVQVFEGTQGIDVDHTQVRFLGDVARLDLSPEILGRIFSGRGEPIDGGPRIVADERRAIHGEPINPSARDHPSEFIQTGISAIDGLNTLVRGQKLPIFSGFGLPANEIAAQIAAQASVVGPITEDTDQARGPSDQEATGEGERFVVVFAAIGITHREASFFRRSFESTGALNRVVFFLNLADDPTVERLLTPRAALTAAEYLAYTCDMHVLVILTDLTNYCEALREVGTAREEIPGRRGYPGYMYTDLATIYERAGRIRGRNGSITQLIILSMPDDDITHPIPDLTGYITEGQIVLGRDLHRRGIYPPIEVLPCLSRLMNAGIGAGRTRADHRNVADQLYSFYAQALDLRRLVAIVGEAALSERDRLLLAFADGFESQFVTQGPEENRSIRQTLDIAWDLLSMFSPEDLKRIKQDYIACYHCIAP